MDAGMHLTEGANIAATTGFTTSDCIAVKIHNGKGNCITIYFKDADMWEKAFQLFRKGFHPRINNTDTLEDY